MGGDGARHPKENWGGRAGAMLTSTGCHGKLLVGYRKWGPSFICTPPPLNPVDQSMAGDLQRRV